MEDLFLGWWEEAKLSIHQSITYNSSTIQLDVAIVLKVSKSRCGHRWTWNFMETTMFYNGEKSMKVS